MTSPGESEERDFSDDTELEEEGDTEQSTEQNLAEEEASEAPLPSDVQESPPPMPPVQVPDRYEIHRCKLNFSITMLEDDGHSDGRPVLIGVRNDEDIPLMELVRASDVSALLPALVALQARLENDLPQRQEAMGIKLEEAWRKQQVAKATPKREAKPRSVPATSAALPPTSPPDTGVETTAPAAATPTTHVAAKTPAKTKQKATQQEDERPFEQMTLFSHLQEKKEKKA